MGCSSLTCVSVSNPEIIIKSFVFDECSSLSLNEYGNAFYLGNEANPYIILMKAKDNSITECDIHPNTCVIYTEAFAGCFNLEEIYIPDFVRSIGRNAFAHCEKLKNVRIPSSLSYIDVDVFGWCESIEFNEYDNAFYLGNEDNPYHVLVKAKWEITSCVINENTVIIADGAFSICNKLESVTIPNSVEFIGNNAFAHCRSLQTIVIPQSVKVVDGYLIFGCTSMKTVYCGAQSQPNGWYSDWNADGVKVVWGYQG
jgi:hypothetical protein